MPDVIYSLSVSLDGYVADATGSLEFVHIDEEIHRALNAEQATVGCHVYGRRMWQVMAATWPTWDQNPTATPWEVDWARIWQAMPKVVVSRTLDRVDEPLTELTHDDPAAVVERLKGSVDGDISVGGPTLAARLFEADLIDDVRILVQPVVLGSGLPFFPAGGDRKAFGLVASRSFGGGVMGLHYRRDRAGRRPPMAES
jgi:dihydrofolate reductase